MSEAILAWYREHMRKAEDAATTQGARAVLTRQLRVRFGNVPASAMARIEAADVTRIEQWCERVLTAQTLDEVFGDSN